MIASIFARVSADTNGDLLSTRETVFFETCAKRAISLMVGRSGRGAGSAGLSVILSPGDTSFFRRDMSLNLLLLSALGLFNPNPPCWPDFRGDSGRLTPV